MTEREQHRSEPGLSVGLCEHTVSVRINKMSTYSDVALQVVLDWNEGGRSKQVCGGD